MYSSILLNTVSKIREVGSFQLSRFRSGNLRIDTKFNKNDVVTEVDRISERMLIDYITDNYPTHSIVSEETGEHIVENSEYCWVIDPLDGTANYSTGLPVFSISVALQKNGENVLGIVYAPYLNELFHSVKGEGAFLNGDRIRVSECRNLGEATVATGFPVDRTVNPDNNIDVVSRVLPEVRALRRLGSAAIDICYVAAGILDGYWEMNLHQWDVAAAELILQEAGGLSEYYRFDRNISIAAASPGIMKPLLSLITNRP